MNEVLAVIALAATLVAAVTRPRFAPDWVVATGAALLLLAAGVLTVDQARRAFEGLGPTVAFLAALLVLADGCRRGGLFAWVGSVIAAGAHGRPRRVLGMVFVAAAATTTVLSLDATVVLLTPVVFATTSRLRISPRPHIYACTHLANTASLFLPVSNLTNLLAVSAPGHPLADFVPVLAPAAITSVMVTVLVLAGFFCDDSITFSVKTDAALP